jgi:CheY-like chemotaxis protein
MNQFTILHVEDDANDVLLLEHACRKAEVACNLQSVPDGDEALAYLQGQAQYADRTRFPLPKFVLLDLKMPRLSGFDVLAWVRKDKKFSLLPVVVLSSSNHDVDIKKAYELGANSYVLKPVEFEALADIIAALYRYWAGFNMTVAS